MGDVFVQGQNAETAKKLLDAVGEDGDASVIRTVEDGFLIPEEIANKVYPEGVPEPAEAEQPDEQQSE